MSHIAYARHELLYFSFYFPLVCVCPSREKFANSPKPDRDLVGGTKFWNCCNLMAANSRNCCCIAGYRVTTDPVFIFLYSYLSLFFLFFLSCRYLSVLNSLLFAAITIFFFQIKRYLTHSTLFLIISSGRFISQFLLFVLVANDNY